MGSVRAPGFERRTGRFRAGSACDAAACAFLIWHMDRPAPGPRPPPEGGKASLAWNAPSCPIPEATRLLKVVEATFGAADGPHSGCPGRTMPPVKFHRQYAHHNLLGSAELSLRTGPLPELLGSRAPYPGTWPPDHPLPDGPAIISQNYLSPARIRSACPRRIEGILPQLSVIATLY